jgi:putative transposase
MPNYRRAREGSTYFFTAVTHQRRPILCEPRARAALRAAILETRAAHPLVIEAWVLLADHLHCLWSIPDGDTDDSIRWALIKRGFTKRVTAGTNVPRVSTSPERHRESAIWQRRFWEHQVRDERDFAAHCDYVHYNPVKHGLVAAPKDWPGSIFHRFVQQGSYPQDRGSAPQEFPAGVGRE